MDAAELLAGIDPREVAQIVSLDHADPHHVLGPHLVPDGLIVRAFRPDAARVQLVSDSATPAFATREMVRVHPSGLFATRLDGIATSLPYAFEIYNHHGEQYRLRDPYAVLPTLGEMDTYLAHEGRHWRLYDKLGAHVRTHFGTAGAAFAVWAPNARRVSVVGEWNGWDGRYNPMRRLGDSGIWELFVPDLQPGAKYKFEVAAPDGRLLLKLDAYAFRTEVAPGTAAVLTAPSAHTWGDDAWIRARRARDPIDAPMTIYEVHLGSWMRVPEEGNRWLTYRELAVSLVKHVSTLGFTHVELLPVAEHPFSGSWGYQVTGYFAPTSRFGTPDDFRHLVDELHKAGIGVILDWVPAHFPKDAFALAKYDGTALYEHADPRQGEQLDWGTLVFNFGRNEVRNFLVTNALYWLDRFHIDGLRVDAVASMLYLDFSRSAGQWVPNRFGGRENLDAIAFLRELNERVHVEFPGAMVIAEESTAWPGVSRPTYTGGLGFTFKWNMGWMHDTLDYFAQDPIYRRYHHAKLTFGIMYAFTENFVLPFSHDEVVHLKKSLLGKMPGDRWQKFANLRALYGYMWAQPGKKLLFMGGEIAQATEWNHDRSLDWHATVDPLNDGVARLLGDLNAVYRAQPALWQMDNVPDGFDWLVVNDSDQSVLAFVRWARDGSGVLCVLNATPVVRAGYRIGVPRPGFYRELINTDAAVYGGSNVGNNGGLHSREVESHGRPYSIDAALPPLAVLFFELPAAPADAIPELADAAE